MMEKHTLSISADQATNNQVQRNLVLILQFTCVSSTHSFISCWTNLGDKKGSEAGHLTLPLQLHGLAAKDTCLRMELLFSKCWSRALGQPFIIIIIIIIIIIFFFWGGGSRGTFESNMVQANRWWKKFLQLHFKARTLFLTKFNLVAFLLKKLTHTPPHSHKS